MTIIYKEGYMNYITKPSVSRTYQGIEPKVAELYQSFANSIRTSLNAMQATDYERFYDIFSKASNTQNLEILFAKDAQYPEQTVMLLDPNGSDIRDRADYAQKALANQEKVLAWLDAKGGFGGLYHINREAAKQQQPRLLPFLAQAYSEMQAGRYNNLAARTRITLGTATQQKQTPQEVQQQQTAAFEKEKEKYFDESARELIDDPDATAVAKYFKQKGFKKTFIVGKVEAPVKFKSSLGKVYTEQVELVEAARRDGSIFYYQVTGGQVKFFGKYNIKDKAKRDAKGKAVYYAVQRQDPDFVSGESKAEALKKAESSIFASMDTKLSNLLKTSDTFKEQVVYNPNDGFKQYGYELYGSINVFVLRRSLSGSYQPGCDKPPTGTPPIADDTKSYIENYLVLCVDADPDGILPDKLFSVNMDTKKVYFLKGKDRAIFEISKKEALSFGNYYRTYSRSEGVHLSQTLLNPIFKTDPRFAAQLKKCT